jgi:ABC-type multidrug transport system ATPase subunit
MRVLRHPVPVELPQVIGRIGAPVETPLFFPNLSGRRNLALLANASATPITRVEGLLELVDLRLGRMTRSRATRAAGSNASASPLPGLRSRSC